MRVELSALKQVIHRLRCDKLDNLITTMRRSAREMLHMSRDL